MLRCSFCPAVCSSGFYHTGTLTCAACPVNTFSSVIGAASCAACPQPKISNSLRTQCVCPPGYQSTSTGCTPCPAGFYSAQPASATCMECQAPYVLSAAQDACTCPMGYYLDDTGGQMQCLPCASGTFSGATDSATCLTCEASHQLATDQTTCKCAVGYYESSGGVCGEYFRSSVQQVKHYGYLTHCCTPEPHNAALWLRVNQRLRPCCAVCWPLQSVSSISSNVTCSHVSFCVCCCSCPTQRLNKQPPAGRE